MQEQFVKLNARLHDMDSTIKGKTRISRNPIFEDDIEEKYDSDKVIFH